MGYIDAIETIEKRDALIHDIREQTNIVSMSIELYAKTGDNKHRKNAHVALRRIEQLVEDNI